METYKDLKILFSEKQKIKLIYIFLVSSLIPFFEIVGISSIPAFAILIIDLDKFLSILSTYISIDFLSQMPKTKITLIAASCLVLAFLIKNIYLFFAIYFQGAIFKKLRYETTLKLFKHYINLPFIEHKNKDPAVLIRIIESDVFRSFTWITSCFTVIRESIILLSILTLLIVADPIITSLLFLFLVIPLSLFYFSYRKILKIRGGRSQELLGKKYKTINQSLGLIKETKILSRESFFFNSFSKTISEVEKIQFFNYLVVATPKLFLEVLALSAVALISAALIFMGKSPEAILPIISLFAVSVVRFVPGLNAITSALTTQRYTKPSFEIIVKEIKNLVPPKNINHTTNHEKEISLKKEIILSNVSFDYLSEKKTILKNINLKVEKGTSVGIIGRSGSGKSTLVDIILGLLEPNNGKILVDEIDIKYNKHSWQKNIGYIPQDIYLLDDTIKNNIVFGIDEEKVDYKLLNESIKIAQLEKFIELSKNKLDTIVGNRGIKISGGEKQRIGIARALYNNPKILIFDEATSALDIDNENKILEEIYDGIKDKTLIIISHRNNTVKYCKSIYVMEQGEVIDQGPYREIMDRHQYLKDGNLNKY
jgi:ATP-binding cassette, subfamily B, bacterial PglK